jgi:hypothetical protein
MSTPQDQPQDQPPDTPPNFAHVDIDKDANGEALGDALRKLGKVPPRTSPQDGKSPFCTRVTGPSATTTASPPLTATDRLYDEIADWTLVVPTADDAIVVAQQGDGPGFRTAVIGGPRQVGKDDKFILVTPDTDDAREVALGYGAALTRRFAVVRYWVLSEFGSKYATLREWCEAYRFVLMLDNDKPWLHDVGMDGQNGDGQHSVECVECVDVPRIEEWPPLRLGVLPPPAVFPLDALPQTCVDLAKEIARTVGCDVSSVASSMLAIAGGVIGRSMHLKIQDNWVVPPIIYHANVADPGQGKSWAQRYLTDGYIQTIEEELEAEFAVDKQIYRQKCQTDKKTVHDKPVPKQLIIDDSTIEALFVALGHNPRGLLATLDELTVLFAGLNQYKGGKGADRSHFLKLWTGARVSINRIRSEFGEPLRIPFPHLSVTGNIPPGELPLICGPHGNDGMLDRWLYSFPDWHPKHKSSERRSVSPIAIAGWNQTIKRLWGWKMVSGTDGKSHPHLLEFDEGGRREFFASYDRHVDEFNDQSFPHYLRGPWSKLEIYAGRLALILHALHAANSRGDTIRPVPLFVAGNAWKLVDYFKSEHKRVLASLNECAGFVPEGARLHLNWIKNHPGSAQFTERDISVTYPPNKGYTPAMMVDGRQWLSEKNAILRMSSTVRREGVPGRKPAPIWAIHPDLRTSTHSTHSTKSTQQDNPEEEPE